MISKHLLQSLARLGVAYEENVSLKSLSTFRIGGEAALALYPDSAEELAESVRLLRQDGFRFEVIGNGSNLLFCDGLFEGALILTQKMNTCRAEGNTLIADAGVSLATLAGTAAQAALTGLEFARGIPGTVGGALVMNAGAYGGAMADVTVKSLALNVETGEISELTDHGYGYRKSVYLSNGSLICLGGAFALSEGDKEKIMETMRCFAAQRKEKQPLEVPSAGSYFKRPEGHFAGKLIEDCGLKGYTVGGAQISRKHAGFIINIGNATASDVLRLEELARGEVYRRFGVTLEREVRFIG